jgi:hypothetical protein
MEAYLHLLLNGSEITTIRKKALYGQLENRNSPKKPGTALRQSKNSFVLMVSLFACHVYMSTSVLFRPDSHLQPLIRWKNTGLCFAVLAGQTLKQLPAGGFVGADPLYDEMQWPRDEYTSTASKTDEAAGSPSVTVSLLLSRFSDHFSEFVIASAYTTFRWV